MLNYSFTPQIKPNDFPVTEMWKVQVFQHSKHKENNMKLTPILTIFTFYLYPFKIALSRSAI